MSFVDHVRVKVSAGTGGAGQASFHREKFVPKGGPNGGDGGSGGSVIFVADPSLGSLSPYVRNRRHVAANGGKGGPHTRDGANGDDVILNVPVGTVVREASTGEMLADLAREGVRYVAARGGRGGRGNAALKGTHDRVPNYAEQGEPGDSHELDLELHLVADAGLIGAPNAGKSTLLSVISRAHPKIADYPFTTIEPGLGVVTYHDERFTVADLPGLIEGASVGKGLGLRFLRHAERCATLVVVVDLAGADPVGDLEAVTGEVGAYDPELATRMRIVVGNKTDLASADVDGACSWAQEHGMHFVAISAAAETNLKELKEMVASEIARSKAEIGEPETFQVYRPAVEDRVVVVRDGEAFRVHSERVERLVVQAALDNPRAVRRLQRQLRSLGVESALKREGATEGAEVRIGDIAFEWIPDA